MTITYLHNAGSWEGLDLTLKSRFDASSGSGGWDSANTNGQKPIMKCGTESPLGHSWPKVVGNNEIHFNEETLVTPMLEANGDTWQETKHLVYIDIFASSMSLLKLFILEANRIIWELRPNSAIRIKKSNGTDNSPIDHFDRNSLEWVQERPLVQNVKVQEHASGVLGCILYKSRT